MNVVMSRRNFVLNSMYYFAIASVWYYVLFYFDYPFCTKGVSKMIYIIFLFVSLFLLCKTYVRNKRKRTDGIILVWIILSFVIYGGISFFVNRVNEKEVFSCYGEECSLKNNIETIALIRDDDVFQKLNYEEKCKVCEAIVRCEGRYLGLDRVQVIFDDNMADSKLGCYNGKSNTIRLNAKVLMNGSVDGGSNKEVLNTILHEARHAYQAEMVGMYCEVSNQQRNLLCFQSIGVDEWLEERKNYVSAEKSSDYSLYAEQAVEVDAREYAEYNTEIYFMEIDAILDGKL